MTTKLEVRILRGETAEEWKNSRRQVFRDNQKAQEIDGIKIIPKFVTWTVAVPNPDFYKSLSEV